MVVAGAGRADAHICTNPAAISVGEQVKLNIGVASEEKPVTSIDIAIPPGFDLTDQIGYLGWVGTRVGDHAHFEGLTLKPYSCGYFTLVGTATKKGAYFAAITVHADDGTSKEYIDKNPYSPYPAFAIYAGEPIPDAGVTPGGGGGGTSVWVIVAVALIAGGVAVGFAWFVNNRRDA
ncbi:MAG: hypothetical protein QOJ00_852 [Actinomycetota bacterium]